MSVESHSSNDLGLYKKGSESYDLSLYTGWTGVPSEDLARVQKLLCQVNFVKTEPPDIGEFLAEPLQFLLRRNWERHEQRAPNRTKAPVVFLPRQEELAFSGVDLGPTIVVPGVGSFDEAEWVTQNMTVDVLDSKISRSVYIVGRIQGPNDKFNLESVVQRLRELGYTEITLATTCLAWSRQDRSNPELGQPNTTAVNILTLSSILDRLVVLEPHSIEVGRNALKNELVYFAFSGWRRLVDIFLDYDIPGVNLKSDKILFGGPDGGARAKNNLAAAYLGSELEREIGSFCLDKSRDSKTGKLKFSRLSDEEKAMLEDAVIVVIDDTIATAGTTGGLKEIVMEPRGNIRGAKGVVVLSTHASLQEEAVRILTSDGFLAVFFSNSRRFLHQPPIGHNMYVFNVMPWLVDFIQADRQGGFNPWQDPAWADIVC